VAQNFSVPKTYTVTAPDGSKQEYTVIADIDASHEQTVTATNNQLYITPNQKGILIKTLSYTSTVQAEIPRGSIAANAIFDMDQVVLAESNIPDIKDAKLFSGLAFRILGLDENKLPVESFQKDMTVTLDLADLPRNTASLKVYYFNTSRKSWIPVSGVTFSEDKITFITDRLATFAVFQVPIPAPSGIVDGDIIQCRNCENPDAVYIVKIVGKQAYIRHIVSLQIFNYYRHLKWENLKQVDSLAPFSLSGWVRVNTGTNGTPKAGDKVWEINGDQSRHWINMSAAQFLSHGGSDEAIYNINAGELNLYALGPDVVSL
jgi:hypothetical protein